MRKIALLISSLIFGTSLFAQISVGLTAGLNFCTVKQNIDYSVNSYLIKPDETDVQITNGLIIGIPLEVKLSNKLSVLAEIKYHQKGAKITQKVIESDGNMIVKGSTKFGYLEFPIQGKFYFTRKNFSTYLLFGPSFGYAINGRSKFSVDMYYENLESTHESSDERINSKDFKDGGFNRFDISIAIGVGLSYKVWIGDIFFNINYNHGLIDMINDDVEINNGVTQFHRGISTTFGYLISLQKQN